MLEYKAVFVQRQGQCLLILKGNINSFFSFLLGSTPGGTGSITGSISEKRPSNPFVLQGQGVQLGDIPSTSCKVARPVGDHQISQIGSEALPYLPQTTVAKSIPFTEITNPGSSQVPFRAEGSTNSEASFKR